jgi:two-component SAPR family response regulator
MGQEDLALEQFSEAMADWPAAKAPKKTQVLAAFLAGRTRFNSLQYEEAETLLDKALRGSAQLGFDQFLVSAARSGLDYLSYFAKAKSSEQIQTLLRRTEEFTTGKLALEHKAAEVTLTPMHMEVRAFGAGEIRRDGELLPTSMWRSSRARALFFYILDHGKVRKEAIGLDFWPDFSSGKISSNFHATLWRVRQALGFKEAVVFENEQYSLHSSIGIWYDVAEFENNLKRGGEAGLSIQARSELIRQAIDLYDAPFLQDIYMEWADQRREQLRSLYLEALIDMAAIESSGKHYRAAKNNYERVLAVDPYRDEVHLALMKCLALSGASSSAIAHFKDYRAMLRRDLNAEPLPELQAYYDQLAVKA